MKQSSETADVMLELVRAVDPAATPATEADTEAALRAFYAELPARNQTRPQPRPRRRRAFSTGLIAVGAAAAAIIVANVLPSGQGGIPGALQQSGVVVSPAQAAKLVSRIKQALTFGPGKILELKSIQTAVGGTLNYTEHYDFWQSTTAPYRERVSWESTSGHTYEEAPSATGVFQIYDQARNTIYEPKIRPTYDLTPGPKPGSWILTVPRASEVRAGYRLPASARGTEQLTISDAQARALRKGLDFVLYVNAVVGDAKRLYANQPEVEPSGNVTGSGAPWTPAAWVAHAHAKGLQVSLDGKRAIKIYSKAQDTTWWFAAKTMTPLEQVTKWPILDKRQKPTGRDYVYTTRFTTYRLLSGPWSLLLLQDAYPTAKLVIGEKPFAAAQRRLTRAQNP